MKTLFRTSSCSLIALVVLGSAVLGSQTKHAKAGSGKVEMKKDWIVLHPAVQLSDKDENALNDALNRHSKAIFIVETIDNGKKVAKPMVGPEGVKMSKYKEYYTTEKPMVGQGHRSHHIFLCGAGCQTQNSPPMGPENVAESRRLIKELQPVLKKYE